MAGLFFVEYLSCWANKQDYREAAMYYERQMDLAFFGTLTQGLNTLDSWNGPFVPHYNKAIDCYEKAGLQDEVDRVRRVFSEKLEDRSMSIQRQNGEKLKLAQDHNARDRADLKHREDNPELYLLADVKGQLSSLNSKMSY